MNNIITSYSDINHFYIFLFSSNHFEEEIDRFLRHLNSQNKLTPNSITYAAQYGKLEAVKYLTSINIPIIDTYPLDLASHRGHYEVVEYLLSIEAPYSVDAENWVKSDTILELLHSKPELKVL